MDERRAHEVHAGVRNGHEFVVKESAYANDDADEVAESAQRITEPWEGQYFLMDLEKRLSLLGRYWRLDVAAQHSGWTPVKPTDAFARLDLEAMRGAPYEGRVAFHHYHQPGAHDALLLSVAHATARGPRHLLAKLSFEFPDAEGGDLRLLHARLPAAVARSVLAREHLSLAAGGHAKLRDGRDVLRVHGRDAPRLAALAYDAALRRVAAGGFGKAQRGREVPVDELYTDYAAALADPRLLALHARFLQPGEEERLLEAGEATIRRFIQRKRQETEERDQHLLTLLQASLLARDGLRATAAVDPEVAALVRRFAYYL